MCQTNVWLPHVFSANIDVYKQSQIIKLWMPLNINMHILYDIFLILDIISDMHIYRLMNEKRISQIKTSYSDRQKNKLWILWLQKGQMHEWKCFYVWVCMHIWKHCPRDPFKKPNHIMAPHRREMLHPDVKMIPHHAR